MKKFLTNQNFVIYLKLFEKMDSATSEQGVFILIADVVFLLRLYTHFCY